MKQNIAFFDFDGTITHQDSLIEFIKFYKGSIYAYVGMGLHLPVLVAMKAGLISTQRAKEMILSFFFKNESAQKFNEKCRVFCSRRLPLMLRPAALEAIQGHQKNGDEVVIVSASASNWVSPWAERLHLKVIATNLLIIDQKINGKIMGRNCKGAEKTRRINLEYKLSDYAEIYVYGDSSGDKEMLSLGTKTFYKPFRA